jgi:hypothetical protein
MPKMTRPPSALAAIMDSSSSATITIMTTSVMPVPSAFCSSTV